MDLEELIKDKKIKVGIIGMGYVGLPHAVEIANAGMEVAGIDVQQKRVDQLNRGVSYIGDVKNADINKIIAAKKFKATTDLSVLAGVDVIIICVPTPLDKYKVPDVSYIKNSALEIKKYLHQDQLVILESTTYPGTTEEILLPLFEETGLKCGKDFYLAFAPERIDPGNKMPLNEIPKVVGGVTSECTRVAAAFYRQFLKHVYPVSSARAAEMTKLLENTYRLINISAINELAMLAAKMDIDIWEVIEAAKTKPYGFAAFYPSPKVGGHCIPLDPFYLSWKAKEYNFWARFIELAGEINEQMPHYTITTAITALNRQSKSLKGSTVLIFGVAYKKDINDARQSAAYDIIPDLMRKGADVEYFDPYVKEFTIPAGNFMINNKEPKPIKWVDYSIEMIKKYDLVLILTDHSGFDYEELANNAKCVVDPRWAVKGKYDNVLHV
jgi:UDP-N-acetyl-D-glucosamine dehydrogenase